MNYFTLSADYRTLGLSEMARGPVEVTELGVPDELVSELLAWNERYQPVVPLGATERATPEVVALIGELDELGLDLSRRLAAAVGGGTKVSYFSEGLLRRLP